MQRELNESIARCLMNLNRLDEALEIAKKLVKFYLNCIIRTKIRFFYSLLSINKQFKEETAQNFEGILHLMIINNLLIVSF